MIGRRPVAAGPWEGWSGPVRWLTLVGIALFLVWAAGRLSEPQRWLWWETDLAGAATKADAEEAPTPRKLSSGGRRAPVPDEAILAGALDGEPFWAESAANPLRSPHIERRRRDADARYHLLLLVRAAIPETLLLDAEPSPPWTELLERPERHRGRLLRVQGHCFGLRRMPLIRSDVPGLTHCYQAFLSTGGTSEPRLLVLFTDLPDADLPPESEWARFWRRDVAAVGFFLKVVRLEAPAGGEPASLPVLVARTLLVPPATEAASGPMSASAWWIFAGMAGPLLLLLIGLSWRWRREDQPWLERRRRVESRQRAAETDHFTAWAAESSAPTSDLPGRPVA